MDFLTGRNVLTFALFLLAVVFMESAFGLWDAGRPWWAVFHGGCSAALCVVIAWMREASR